MNVQARTTRLRTRARRKAAALLAFAFTLFAVLVPALHDHWNWMNPGRAQARTQRYLHARAQTASTTIHSVSAVDNGDCPLCDWLVTATYAVSSVSVEILFLLATFLLPAIALCIPSLCARPSPRTAPRAPPFALAA